jgi:hypothetical protein
MNFTVSWRGGVWLIGLPDRQEPIRGDGAALDQWLADRGAGRADLDFGRSPALEEKFVHDFGPLPGVGGHARYPAPYTESGTSAGPRFCRPTTARTRI